MNYRLPDETLAAIQSYDDSSLLETEGSIDARFVFTQMLFFAGGNDRGANLCALETLANLASDIGEEIVLMELPTNGLRPWNPRGFREIGEAAIYQAFAPSSKNRNMDFAIHGTRNGGVSAFGGSICVALPFSIRCQ